MYVLRHTSLIENWNFLNVDRRGLEPPPFTRLELKSSAATNYAICLSSTLFGIPPNLNCVFKLVSLKPFNFDSKYFLFLITKQTQPSSNFSD